MFIKKGFTTKLRTSSPFWISLIDVLLSSAHTFEERYPWKIATRLPVSFVHADGWIMSPANLHDCETNQFHFSLSPLDIISTVVTQFLSPAFGNDSNWALCWQASTHGWSISTFHSRCDGKSHTITVIRKDPYVFGGYTDIPWCKWLFRPGRGNKRDGVRKIKIKPVKKPNWTSLGSIWQIIKQVTNSRTNQEL